MVRWARPATEGWGRARRPALGQVVPQVVGAVAAQRPPPLRRRGQVDVGSGVTQPEVAGGEGVAIARPQGDVLRRPGPDPGQRDERGRVARRGVPAGQRPGQPDERRGAGAGQPERRGVGAGQLDGGGGEMREGRVAQGRRERRAVGGGQAPEDGARPRERDLLVDDGAQREVGGVERPGRPQPGARAQQRTEQRVAPEPALDGGRGRPVLVEQGPAAAHRLRQVGGGPEAQAHVDAVRPEVEGHGRRAAGEPQRPGVGRPGHDLDARHRAGGEVGGQALGRERRARGQPQAHLAVGELGRRPGARLPGRVAVRQAAPARPVAGRHRGRLVGEEDAVGDVAAARERRPRGRAVHPAVPVAAAVAAEQPALRRRIGPPVGAQQGVGAAHQRAVVASWARSQRLRSSPPP